MELFNHDKSYLRKIFILAVCRHFKLIKLPIDFGIVQKSLYIDT